MTVLKLIQPFRFRLPSIKVNQLVQLEVVLTFLLLLTFTGANAPFLPISQFGRIFSYPILLILIACHWKRFLSLASRDVFLILLIFLAIASISWSVSPETTMQHARGMLRSSMFGIYLATRYSLKDQLYIMASVFGVAIVMSFAISLAFPSVGIHMGGLWRGAFSHKNFMGRNMNIGAQVFLLLALYQKRKPLKYYFWLGFMLSTLLVLLSRSTTALATLLMLAFLIPIYKILKQPLYKTRVFVAIFTLLCLIASSVLVVSVADILLATQGKDLSFTGRTDMWDLLMNQFFPQKSLLGYGYMGFWDRYGYIIHLSEPWGPKHAHNGYIELLLALGVVGLALYLLSLLPTLLKAFFRMLSAHSELDFWYLQLLLTMLISDLTLESNILASGNIVWILFVAAVFSLKVPHRSVQMSGISSQWIR
jgi:exopolysaccharide production protein ExoQ